MVGDDVGWHPGGFNAPPDTSSSSFLADIIYKHIHQEVVYIYIYTYSLVFMADVMLRLGFMTNEGSVTFSFLVAIFIANFPEAFSGASLLLGQKMPVSRTAQGTGL